MQVQRKASTIVGMVGLLFASASSLPPLALADTVATGSAPESLRCSGLINVEASRPGPEYELRGWDYRWEVFNQDATISSPFGVAVDRNCNVYVANYSPTGGNVVKLSSDGKTVAEWGTPGHGAGQFERLEGVAVDANGNIYAADSANSRVQKLTSSGSVDMVWGSQFKCRDLPGTKCQVVPDDAGFHGNLSVGVDGTGKLFVVDGSYGMRVFNSAGPLSSKWGKALSSEPGGFRAADGVAFDNAGNIYVADALNYRIQKFAPDGSTIAQWGSKDGKLAFNQPAGVAVDLEGNVYVADTDNQRLVMLSPSGEYVTEWGRCFDGGTPCQRPGIGDAAGEFAQPHHVQVNARGELFVADRANNRIQVRKAYPVWVSTKADQGTGTAASDGPAESTEGEPAE
jgi:tripartite motif-containing protein 71